MNGKPVFYFGKIKRDVNKIDGKIILAKDRFPQISSNFTTVWKAPWFSYLISRNDVYYEKIGMKIMQNNERLIVVYSQGSNAEKNIFKN